MLPEQQQRIMGYFIEEAKDHLNTIEQGLLSLQATIEDSEKANEVFRAAHSVKGGAAMLGLDSIQQIAHRMEDYFKVLKEAPVTVDRTLETMFLRTSDGLKDLLEQLEGPFGLTQDKAQEIMADVEPVFERLESHLNSLVSKAGSKADRPTASHSPEALQATFKQDVAALLRQMLAAFKQADNAETRKKIQNICTQLFALGEQFELDAWCDLIETARLASASTSNDYRSLAPVLIKDIKKAQGLVLSGRASEVAVSEAMQALLPEDVLANDLADTGPAGLDELDFESGLEASLSELDEDFESPENAESAGELDGLFSDEPDLPPAESAASLEALSLEGLGSAAEDSFADTDAEDDFDGLFESESDHTELDFDSGSEADSKGGIDTTDTQTTDDLEIEDDISRLSLDLDFDEIPSELSTLNRSDSKSEKADESLDALLATVNVTGPDVGTEELNSLADLFDGDLDELDNTLGGHAFISEEMQLHPEKIDMSTEGDLTDLLATDSAVALPEVAVDGEVDDDLFGGTLTDEEFAIADEASLDDFSLDSLNLDISDIDVLDSSVEEDTAPEAMAVDMAADMAALSEDLWEEDSNDELFGGSVDELLEAPADTSEELETSAGIDFDTEDSENLESSNVDQLETPIVREPAVSQKAAPRELDIEFPTLTGVQLLEAEEAIDSFFLDTEPEDSDQPTGKTNNKAGETPTFDAFEEAIDEDFLESEAGSELQSGEQLADDPWGELAVESTLTGIDDTVNQNEDNLSGLEWSTTSEPQSSTDDIDLEAVFLGSERSASFDVGLDVEQAGSELDELLEVSEEVSHETKSDSPEIGFDSSSSFDLDTDELWGDLVSLPEEENSEEADSESLYFEEADSEKNEEESSDLTLNLMSETTEDSEEIEDVLSMPDAEIASVEDSSNALEGFDVSGDELSAEILADFETAFGGEEALDELLESSVADSSEDASDGLFLDASEFESDEVPASASEPVNDILFTDDIEDAVADNLSDDLDDALSQEVAIDTSEIDALDINDLEIDDLLDFDSLDGDRADDIKTDIAAVAEIEDDSDEALDGFLTEDELAAIDDEPLQFDLPQPEAIAIPIPPADNFGDLDSLLAEESSDGDDFDNLDSLLAEEDDSSEPDTDDMPTFVGGLRTSNSSSEESHEEEDFGDLEKLLEDGPDEGGGAPLAETQRRSPQRAVQRRSSGGVREQNMRVSVKHLDTLSNLVGELVVSRNTLERDQERLRQFLDNLLFQVQQLNDVGQRMRDLYERSLLESSLMSNRRAHDSANAQQADPTAFEDHATGETFDALEMDRFTGFHTLSQEMIELIVRVRESSSDIGYTVESSDQVTRQFRQITTQLQEGLNTARMVAFSQAADRLPRAVRDISLKCGKEARLIVEGQDTLIDKMIVEHLYDPLTHLVNNAITHGIEPPEERKKAGKLPEGSITVRAFYQGNQTVIYVADDGGGINTEFVKRKAIEKNLIGEAEAADLSDLETYELLFHPGFSTRDQADDFAGRGVGMDVVRTSLADIRGSVTIDSEMGKGTSFTIRLPLTLSISKALSCVSNQARIAFPMDGVEDMLDVPRDRIVKNEQDQDCVKWRDTLLPFQPVTNLLKFNRTLGRSRVYGGSQDDDVLSIIVLRSANTYIAVQVDQVIGEQEIVIKQLEGPVPKPLGIAGATVLGDGRVMPIADVLELIDIAMGRIRRDSASMTWAQDAAKAMEEAPVKNDPTVLIVDDSITVRELLSMSFNKVGYRVEQARDGQEAWDKLRSGLPCDLVFCDIEMPRMDGLELLSRMQKDNHLSSIPIAMLTSRGADRHRQMAVDLGASGYFTKPYLEEALLDAAQRMLNGETLAKGRGG